MSPLRFSKTAFLIALTLGLPSIALGQAAPKGFPSSPVRLVVPYPPGGTVDILARTLADGLTPLLGQPVIVDNRPGAGGTIAAAHVATAKPDGLTLFVSDVGPIAISRSVYANLSVDPVTGLAPISIATISVLNLTVGPNSPAKSLAEFIELAKKKPGAITFASSGVGTVMHMAGELFSMEAGVQLLHVPYRGGAPAVTAVLSGQVDSAFNQLSTTLAYIHGGQMRSLGVSSKKSSPLAPELPSIASQGLSNYEVLVWQGVFAPAKTDPAIIAYLNQKIVEVLKNPDVSGRLVKQGFDVVWDTPEEFSAFVKTEAEKWQRVAKERHIKSE